MFPLLLAQFLVATDPRSMQTIHKIFDTPAPAKNTLVCQIETMAPRLGFSLMHWSGFNLNIPMKQFPETGTTQLALAIEIAPKGGKPVYLGERFGVPPPAAGLRYPKGANATYMGGYYLGPGDYRVRFYGGDNRNNVCRKEWSLKVRPGKTPPRMEPNQISAVGDERWRGLNKSNPPNRLTIVLEAAPMSPRRAMVRLSSYDRSVLLTSLTTLLDQTKATEATVLAVDPRSRKIIYQTSDFTRRELGRLARAVAEVNLGVVSLETLKGPNASQFMENVLSTIQDPAAKSDAVVFLGPIWSWQGKVTPKMRELAQTLPNAHFLGLTRFPGMPDNLVAQVVKAANGSAKQLLTPADFAKALEKVK